MPAMLTKKLVNLVDKLEAYNFQCEGGPLQNCVDWQQLRKDVAEIDACLSSIESKERNPTLAEYHAGIMETGEVTYHPMFPKESAAGDMSRYTAQSYGEVPEPIPPAPTVQSELPEEWQDGIAGACNIVTFDGSDIVGIAYVPEQRHRTNLIAKFNALRSLLAQREEENKGLRAIWFKKGQDSAQRKNESGCCCKIDDDGETILSACAAHKAWAQGRAEGGERGREGKP